MVNGLGNGYGYSPGATFNRQMSFQGGQYAQYPPQKKKSMIGGFAKLAGLTVLVVSAIKTGKGWKNIMEVAKKQGLGDWGKVKLVGKYFFRNMNPMRWYKEAAKAGANAASKAKANILSLGKDARKTKSTMKQMQDLVKQYEKAPTKRAKNAIKKKMDKLGKLDPNAKAFLEQTAKNGKSRIKNLEQSIKSIKDAVIKEKELVSKRKTLNTFIVNKKELIKAQNTLSKLEGKTRVSKAKLDAARASVAKWQTSVDDIVKNNKGYDKMLTMSEKDLLARSKSLGKKIDDLKPLLNKAKGNGLKSGQSQLERSEKLLRHLKGREGQFRNKANRVVVEDIESVLKQFAG